MILVERFNTAHLRWFGREISTKSHYSLWQIGTWLTVNFESVFGTRTNVRRVERIESKRDGSLQVFVHAQACLIVCRKVLELLITVVEQFLPLPSNMIERSIAQAPANSEPSTTSKNTSPDKQSMPTRSKTTFIKCTRSVLLGMPTETRLIAQL